MKQIHKDKHPAISVLMPVYNAEKFLREAVDSILNQTFKDFEFIIISDASKDNTKNIILSYKDPRIRYYENKTNIGLAASLNKGLTIAKGKYIARMDADDKALPNRLEVQYEELIKDSNLVIVSSHFDWMDEGGKFISHYKTASLPEEIFYELQFRNCIGHPTVIFDKDTIVNEFGGYDIKQEAEDNDLWLRISKKHKIVKINQVLMKVRRSRQSKTALSQKSVNESTVAITQNNLQSLLGKRIDIESIRILADHNPLSKSPGQIKETIKILDEVNKRILETYPPFLEKSIILRSSINKKNILSLYLMITILFNSLFGPIFKLVYRFYRSKKRTY